MDETDTAEGMRALARMRWLKSVKAMGLNLEIVCETPADHERGETNLR